ncbi:MAG TPA: helix-turn-helix domain-containing protein [Reyranella sp.]
MKELFARAERIPGVARVTFGSPAVYALRRTRRSPGTIRIAQALMRRHVSVKQAHTAITDLLVEPSVIVELPMLENAKAFEQEVEGQGAQATRIKVPEEVDVKTIRETLGLSQESFSRRFGLDLATVRNWEQKRSRPDTAARVLLRTIEKEPDAVTRALTAA